MASAQLTAVPGSDPLPHLDTATGLARVMPAELRTPAQAASWALTEELINEIKEAVTILLGLPLSNFGAPSSVKAWVDHLIAPGLSVDAETHAPLLAGRLSRTGPDPIVAISDEFRLKPAGRRSLMTLTVTEAGLALADPAVYADEARLHEALTLLRRKAPVHRVRAPGFEPFLAIAR